MKTNSRSLVFSFFSTLLLALIIGILSVIAAKAQTGVNSNVVNGLFTPTQAEKFFQAGREEFEREIKIFYHPELYLGDELLQIDSELIKQINRTKAFNDFQVDDAEYELLQIKNSNN